VEALVALLVVALGAAGAGLLHVRALRTAREAAYLSTAVQVATTLAARMAANRVVLDGADGANPYLHADGSAGRCYAAACTPAELAAFDLAEARLEAAARLPGGRILACRDLASPDPVTGLPPWSCADGPGAPLVVKLGWRTSRAANAPLLVLPVGAGR